MDQPEGSRAAWLRMSMIYAEIAGEIAKSKIKTPKR